MMLNSKNFSLHQILAVLLGVWLGFYLAAGYVVAPILFRHLERMTAGNIAGELFTLANYSGLALWAVVWVYLYRSGGHILGFWSKHRRFSPYAAALVWWLLAANQWLVTPVIVALKTHAAPNWLWRLTGGSFAAWHGVSSVLYLMTGITALLLAVCHLDMVRRTS